ncbi:hypothetical protein ABVK25_007685 [Lepraria finkii]|uniref:Uncharacterized protein n=1 Tax=Lepraria finkii TaxID=1340010 RepID=A0ABR4B3M3_9LECA
MDQLQSCNYLDVIKVLFRDLARLDPVANTSFGIWSTELTALRPHGTVMTPSCLSSISPSLKRKLHKVINSTLRQSEGDIEQPNITENCGIMAAMARHMGEMIVQHWHFVEKQCEFCAANLSRA